MSERILKNLMQLFAMVCRINGEDNNEREAVELFLQHRLNLEESDKYLALFDDFRSGPKSRLTVADNSKMLLICTAINEELTQIQKYSVLMYLFILINMDEKADQMEREFLSSVADIFNIPHELYIKIELFCIDPHIKQKDEDCYLFASNEPNPDLKKARQVYSENLEGYLAFMQIPNINIFLVKYVGDGFYYLNDQLLKSNKPATFRIGSRITGHGLSPVYFTGVSSRFMESDEAREIYFEAEKISYTLPEGKKLLHRLSINESKQSLVAIMGPSGAGKSTLMEVLNGIKQPTKGAVYINGVDLHHNPKQAEGLIGYVPQDDLLIEELTVFDNLYYAAKLCYSQKSEEELIQIVKATLSDLGLSEVAQHKVGNPMDKVISGGERKRVNIGLELLRQPPIMFVDEPTSGLSSRDSLSIMGILKELALKGKVIFTVIHQPSSDIFKLFDKLILLDTGGYPVYYGHPLEALVYFRSRINQINKEQTVCSECGNVNNEQIFDIIEAHTVNEKGQYTNKRKINPSQWNKMFRQHLPEALVMKRGKPLKSEQKIANRLQQWWIFTLRDLKSKLSNRQYMAINLLQAPLLAFILAYINRYSPGPEYLFSKNENIPIFLFISIITALFMGLVVSAEEIFKDRKILKRERFLHLSRSSYLFSKLFIMFSFSAVQTLTFLLVANSILEIQGMLRSYWLILFSVSCFANVLGLNISASFNSAVTIYILIPILIIPQLVLGGAVIDFDKINRNFRISERAVPLLGDLMASRWAFEALAVTQFKENAYNRYFYPYKKRLAQNEFKKLYLLPELHNHLDYLKQKGSVQDLDLKTEIKQRLEILNANSARALKGTPLAQKWSPVDQIDTTTLQAREKLFNQAGRYFGQKIGYYNRINQKVLEQLAEQLGGYEVVQRLKAEHHNERLVRFVENKDLGKRIQLEDTIYYAKIYPVYMPPRPLHILDYRTDFYSAKKHFLGKQFETLSFNVSMLWLMTLVLFVLLYYETLRSVLEQLGQKIGKH